MKVIWITGLSGAGKSTLAQVIVERLRAKGESVLMLDGDELREVFGATSKDKESYNIGARLALAHQYARLCHVVAEQGFTVVIATISLFQEIHAWNRLNIPGYFEVYLKVPIEELRLRDPKNIYSRFDNGELKNVAGLDLPIDEPFAPEWAPDFDPKKTADSLIKELLEIMERQSQNE
jgi:adenylylsulfate kinase